MGKFQKGNSYAFKNGHKKLGGRKRGPNSRYRGKSKPRLEGVEKLAKEAYERLDIEITTPETPPKAPNVEQPIAQESHSIDEPIQPEPFNPMSGHEFYRMLFGQPIYKRRRWG